MTKPILDSIGMNDAIIFYDHFNLKINLEKALLSKWIVLKPYIDLMFTTSDEVVSITLYKQVIRICTESNISALLGSVFNRSSAMYFRITWIILL